MRGEKYGAILKRKHFLWKVALSIVGLEEALHNTKPGVYVEECIRKVTARYIGEADKMLIFDGSILFRK